MLLVNQEVHGLSLFIIIWDLNVNFVNKGIIEIK